MRAEAIFEALLLLMVANGAPLVAKQLLGHRFSYPVDCNVLFSDRSRLFGSSKTIRGLVAAVLATATVAPSHWEWIGLSGSSSELWR